MLSEIMWLLPVFVALELWDAFWKFAGLWYSARTSKWWFLGIAIINSLGRYPTDLLSLAQETFRVQEELNYPT